MENVEKKKVSVIIPNYNYERYIQERILSVLNQTYPVYEIIILDDCSTDSSVLMIENFIANHPEKNIRLVKNTKNSGSVFAQWRKGLECCHGDYFWIAEADDLCDRHFLEKSIAAFDDPEVVLSYSDSKIMDETGKFTSNSSEHIFNFFRSEHWNQSYVNDGNDEVIQYLSSVNTIINVSAVVWKKGNYSELFRLAEEYKVAGDWYVYTQVLRSGKIAYCKKSLNYCRKHQGSVSNIINVDREYQEICKIQKLVADTYSLSMREYRYQRLRRDLMNQTVSPEKKIRKIAWTIPYPGKGSGGHRTIIQNINCLIRAGYDCDLFVPDDGMATVAFIQKLIDESFEECGAKVHVGFDTKEVFDLLYITGWQTIADVEKISAKKTAYFVQDYEPWFFPVGDRYIEIENSYRMGFPAVTIGRWLANKLHDEFGQKAYCFDFCADTNVYFRKEGISKENAVCCIYQPEKDRRCTSIITEGLRLLKVQRPDIRIYLYGSSKKATLPFEAEQLGIIPVSECNELYNKCRTGICMSASNPSRIPFEMMAAGLPVVDLYRENNLYDMPDQGVLLAQPTPEAIAEAVIELLDDHDLQEEMSDFGERFMTGRPLEKGYQQFVEITSAILNDDDSIKMHYGKSYHAEQEMMNTRHIGGGLRNLEVHRRGAMIRKRLLHVKEFIDKGGRKIHFLMTKYTGK